MNVLPSKSYSGNGCQISFISFLTRVLFIFILNATRNIHDYSFLRIHFVANSYLANFPFPAIEIIESRKPMLKLIVRKSPEHYQINETVFSFLTAKFYILKKYYYTSNICTSVNIED